jgi:hypothetical protein
LTRTASTDTDTTGDAAFTINTWYDVGFKISGRTSITFYINGKKYYEPTMTNLPANTVLLSPTAVISAGTAAAATLELQSMTCYQEAI